jgi:2-aminoadipate transaminase
MTSIRYARRAIAVDAPASLVTPAGNVLKLSAGHAFPGLLPDLTEEAAEALHRYRHETLQYGPLNGINDLRDAIAAFVAEDGVHATRENIVVVNGAKQGLDLACLALLEPGDAVIVSAPTYLTAIAIFQMHQATFVEVPQDDKGMIVDALEAQLAARRVAGLPAPKLLFEVPDFHNPTGLTLPVERRQRLVELAREYDFVIVEDDPYRRIRFAGDPVPTIKSFDTDGRVVALGTTSKTLMPGLKIGWINGPADMVRRMAALKSDGGGSPLTQRIAASLFTSGRAATIMAEVTETMRRHRDAMAAAFARHFPEARFNLPQGGYFLWVELPEGADSDAFAAHAAKFGVSVFSGRLSYAGEPRTNYLRLSYSFCSPAEIDTGVKKLGEAFRDFRRG